MRERWEDIKGEMDSLVGWLGPRGEPLCGIRVRLRKERNDFFRKRLPLERQDVTDDEKDVDERADHVG